MNSSFRLSNDQGITSEKNKRADCQHNDNINFAVILYIILAKHNKFNWHDVTQQIRRCLGRIHEYCPISSNISVGQ